MGKSAPKAPAAPDPVALSNAQSTSNIATAQTEAALNRVNQITPQGNLTYTIPDPKNAPNSWTATQTLSPAEQHLYDLSTAAQGVYGQTALNQLNSVSGALSSPMQTPGSPYDAYNAYQKAASQPFNTDYSSVRDQYLQSQYQLQQPEWDRQRSSMQAQLANQGIAQGSDAWNNAMRQTEDNISRSQAQILSGATQNVGQAIQQGLELRQEPLTEASQAAGLYGTGIQQAQGLREMPLNEASALLSGSQVQGPNYVNSAQAQVSPTNMLGAYQLQQNALQNEYNAKMQAYQGAMGGMGSIVGQLGAAGIMAASDERLKTDIHQVGELQQPGGKSVPLKTFRFKGDPVRRLGVVAQDVEGVRPEAVQTHPATGIKSVDYAHLLLASHHAAMQGRKQRHG